MIPNSRPNNFSLSIFVLTYFGDGEKLSHALFRFLPLSKEWFLHLIVPVWWPLMNRCNFLWACGVCDSVRAFVKSRRRMVYWGVKIVIVGFVSNKCLFCYSCAAIYWRNSTTAFNAIWGITAPYVKAYFCVNFSNAFKAIFIENYVTILSNRFLIHMNKYFLTFQASATCARAAIFHRLLDTKNRPIMTL
jgi:hypothetical protein